VFIAPPRTTSSPDILIPFDVLTSRTPAENVKPSPAIVAETPIWLESLIVKPSATLASTTSELITKPSPTFTSRTPEFAVSPFPCNPVATWR
jgi:hypothetical protein